MRRTRGWLLATATALTGLAGCVHLRPAPQPGGAEALPLPAVQRGSVEANITTLPSTQNRDLSAPADPFPAPAYRAMTPRECQCLAVAAAPGASLYNDEAELAAHHLLRLLANNRAADLRRDVLVYTALELQNRAAGTALEAYYHLAEAEGKSELLDLAARELDTAYRETSQMTRQNLRPPVALDVWARQISSTQADRLQAQLTIDQLNSDLRRLVRQTDCNERWRIWNPERYDVTDLPADVEADVCDGLARRPELLMLRLLVRELGPGTLPAARDALRSAYSLLGTSHGPHAGKLAILLALTPAARDELETRRRQLEEYLHERECAVAEEIRLAATTVRYRGRMAALAWERERSWQGRVRDARSRQQQGLASFAEVAQMNLDWLKSRADVVQEVMAWQIAMARLKQARGILVAECLCGDDASANLGAPRATTAAGNTP